MPDPTAAAALGTETPGGSTTTTTTDAAAAAAAAATAAAAAAAGGGDETARLAAEAAAAAARGTTTNPPTQFPADWRKLMVGEDPKELTQAERYASPAQVWKKARELETQISSGVFIRPLAKDATAEQVTEWRKANGVPEKPEDYFTKLPDGLVLGEADKPIFDALAKDWLHKHNVKPEAAHELITWMNGLEEAEVAKATESDRKFAIERADQLRAEWGTDYRANINHVTAFLETAPKGLESVIADARDSSGRLLLSNPDAVRWFAQLARQVNPSLTQSGGGGGDQGSVDDRIAVIEKMMRTNRKDYDKDTKVQKELRDLYSARERLKANAA